MQWAYLVDVQLGGTGRRRRVEGAFRGLRGGEPAQELERDRRLDRGRHELIRPFLCVPGSVRNGGDFQRRNGPEVIHAAERNADSAEALGRCRLAKNALVVQVAAQKRFRSVLQDVFKRLFHQRLEIGQVFKLQHHNRAFDVVDVMGLVHAVALFSP